jgi:hypothetical protein
MTKTAFLQAYRAALLAGYPWAQDTERLEKFMTGVKATLDGGNTFNRDGEAFRAACHAIGLSPRKATLKFLHSMPA